MATKTPDVGDQVPTFTPDVLIIPALVIFDERVKPLDAKVYGVVYWLERLKDGHCWASNATLAKIVGSSSGGVSNALANLANIGYVHLELNPETNQRTSVTTLVNMAKNPTSNDGGGVHQTMDIRNNIKKELTSETRADVDKVYRAWIVYFVIGPDRDPDATTDEREALITQAGKNYRLTDKRRDKIVARLGDAGAAKLLKAIKNISASPFHRGENDREWSATLEWLCNSYEKVEEWANK